ncbi:MAG: PadR family transcriptional regulator [Oscillospiraceae bacterium]|jgi:PadR family transcriptional regulator PadR|nr:PadR family transcriptional regulator [Oscillospiraceae bacterium]
MDAQLKRGLLDGCVLSAIRDEDSYGYRIVRDIEPYISISESTLYPILRRLEAAGQLTVREEAYNGRLRKYYHITPEGRARLEQFREEWKQVASVYQFICRGDSHEEG